jgi:hypothetical protein
LEFDHLKVKNITKQRAILLLIGIFIFRALVTTVNKKLIIKLFSSFYLFFKVTY